MNFLQLKQVEYEAMPETVLPGIVFWNTRSYMYLLRGTGENVPDDCMIIAIVNIGFTPSDETGVLSASHVELVYALDEFKEEAGFEYWEEHEVCYFCLSNGECILSVETISQPQHEELEALEPGDIPF